MGPVGRRELLDARRYGNGDPRLAAAAAGGSGASLYTAMADILPQEIITNLNGKQQVVIIEHRFHFTA